MLHYAGTSGILRNRLFVQGNGSGHIRNEIHVYASRLQNAWHVTLTLHYTIY